MNFLHSPRRPSLRDRLRDESGLTLIEVVVSALLVGLIALSLVGLDAVGSTSADQQRRSQAVEIAQADQERMRAMSADQLQNLSQTRTVTLDGVAFTVTSTGQFLNSASNAGSCTATGTANADYARVISPCRLGLQQQAGCGRDQHHHPPSRRLADRTGRGPKQRGHPRRDRDRHRDRPEHRLHPASGGRPTPPAASSSEDCSQGTTAPRRSTTATSMPTATRRRPTTSPRPPATPARRSSRSGTRGRRRRPSRRASTAPTSPASAPRRWRGSTPAWPPTASSTRPRCRHR